MTNIIDFYSIRFWSFVAVAVLLLGAIKAPRARKWTFALLNLGFLAFHLPIRPYWLVVVEGIVVAWFLLRLAESGPLRAWALAFGGAAILALFVMHKLPRIAQSWLEMNPEPALELIGFSYVALRLVDVARAVGEGRRKAPDLASTINYLLPFHMLSAGPIQAYDDFAEQPDVPPPLDVRGALEAFERIAAGLTKKYLLAAYLQKLLLTNFQDFGPYFLIEIQLQFIWLYLDFSAYSDVAVGIGRLMGVATPENFNRPYLARSVPDFWERWHISLSQFIRRNLFIPIQLKLMRLTDAHYPLSCASVALAVSFVICGLWHGLNVHWLTWGVCQAGGMIVCKCYDAFLVKRLGRKGVKRYLENRWIQVLSIITVFEFNAVVMALVRVPFKEFLAWQRFHSL